MTNKDIHSEEASLVEPKIERRRFLGKGIKAAPFVITLASQPALGTTCFTPSRSLSKNTSISQQGKDGECTNAESPGNYKAQQDSTANAYHWPSTVPPSTLFHPLFRQGGTAATSFQKTVGSVTSSMTLGEVLTDGASQDTYKFAKHMIGAYLNVMGGNGAFIPANVMTEQKIRDIWESYVVHGYYEVTAGVQWTAEQIIDYLKSNGIVK